MQILSGIKIKKNKLYTISKSLNSFKLFRNDNPNYTNNSSKDKRNKYQSKII